MKTLTWLLTLTLLALPARAELKRWWTGNPEDMRPRLHGPLLILAGGGGDTKAALRETIDRLRGCSGCDTKIDVVVIRASGDDDYNPWFMEMPGVDSVLTMVITDRESSMRPDVAAAAADAELIYFGGGDQCNYIRWVKGTALAEGVKRAYRRGAAVGGSSAGLAIQGEIVYDACPDQSAQSAEVLIDPYSVDVSLSRGFFDWPPLRDVITDTHFQQRDRMGRLLVYLARTLEEKKEKRVLGLGVSEGTILLVDRHARGSVLGAGPVHVIEASGHPEVLRRGAPLTYRGFKVWRFDKGETVDLRHLTGNPDKVVDVVEGKRTEDAY